MVENAFGILSSRFRVFHEAMLVHPGKLKDIVLACVVLHHMLRAQRGAGGQDEEIACDLEDGDKGDRPFQGHPVVPKTFCLRC